jgi:hypothetical protein
MRGYITATFYNMGAGRNSLVWVDLLELQNCCAMGDLYLINVELCWA